jgi:hypothetical protein
MTHPSATSAPSADRPFRAARALVGVLLAVIGQAMVIGAAFLAGRVADAGAGDMRTLGAVVGTLLGGELVLLLACVVVGIVLIARGRRDLGAGLLAGGALGALTFATWLIATTR